MAGEFSYDDSLNFDSISHSGIYKCDQCNMFVPYRVLAEHIQSRHKPTSNYFDDGQSLLMSTTGAANEAGESGENAIFRRRAPRPTFLDSDYDTTDTESMVTNTKNQRNAGVVNGGGGNAAAGAHGDNRAHGGRAAVRDGDRFQEKRFAKLRAAREQQQANEQKKSNGNDSASTKTAAAATAQSRRKYYTERFAKGRSQSEARTQKVNGICDNGTGVGGGGVAGNERGRLRKFGAVRRSASVQRAQAIPENYEHCKFCMNLMHKDYVDDHIKRRHQIDEPAAAAATAATTDIDTTANAKESVSVNVGDNDANGHSSSSSDVSNVEGNLNGNRADEATADTKSANKEPKKKGKKINVADKQKDFRRCQLCEAFMHSDYLAGHMIRKHKTDFIGASGITWLKFSDEQMNNVIKDGRLSCKNGALYIKNA